MDAIHRTTSSTVIQKQDIPYPQIIIDKFTESYLKLDASHLRYPMLYRRYQKITSCYPNPEGSCALVLKGATCCKASLHPNALQQFPPAAIFQL